LRVSRLLGGCSGFLDGGYLGIGEFTAACAYRLLMPSEAENNQDDDRRPSKSFFEL